MWIVFQTKINEFTMTSDSWHKTHNKWFCNKFDNFFYFFSVISIFTRIKGNPDFAKTNFDLKLAIKLFVLTLLIKNTKYVSLVLSIQLCKKALYILRNKVWCFSYSNENLWLETFFTLWNRVWWFSYRSAN